MLAIKSAIDRHRRPGRFSPTGSASVLTVPKLSESLAGRMELHTLWPFSQGEIQGRRESFIDRLFAAQFRSLEAEIVAQRELAERLTVGGYPEAQVRGSVERRGAWFDSYLNAILATSATWPTSIAWPRCPVCWPCWPRACQLVNYAELAGELSIPQTTLKRYVALLESTFLVRLLPAWSANLGKRLLKSPKMLLADSGLLTHLLGTDATGLLAERTHLGHVLENFVAMEMLKQLGWSQTRCRMFHFRTEAGQEVDLVLEDATGRLAGIEVKASATVEQRDFRGLQVAEMVGTASCAASCSTPARRTSLRHDFRAVPLAQLWA